MRQVLKKYFINENVSKCCSLEGNFHWKITHGSMGAFKPSGIPLKML
jgi:hypothetical protein